MWKAIIIDDDRQILRIMKKVIPWDKLGITCVGEGTDGEVGLQLIKENNPDIVLTDIYMPIMNGMEMLQHSRENGFDGKVVILSGYSDFEYARTALRLNVHDYLSKPVSIETIETVLTGIIQGLEKEKEKQLDQEDLSHKLEYYQSLYSNSWIKSMMMGIEDQSALEFKQENSHMVDQRHMVISIQIHKSEYEQSELQRPDWATIRNMLRDIHQKSAFTSLKNVEWVELSLHHSAILLSFDKEEEFRTCSKFSKSLVEDLVNVMAHSIHQPISIGIGRLKENWTEIATSTEEAIQAAYFSTDEHIIQCFEEIEQKECEIPKIKLDFKRPVQFYRELSATIKNNQFDQTLDLVETFTKSCVEKNSYLPYQWQLLCKEIWIVLTYNLYDNGINLEEIFDEKKVNRQIDRIETKDQFEDWLRKSIMTIADYQKMNDKENIRHKQAVDYMIQYIHDHYAENITLNELCEQVYISRNYLSQIFKKATGLSFNHYVNKVRMDKAKYLILEGNYLIYEVAEKVGFKNTPYFSSLFKKYTGVNPTDLLKQ